MSSAVRTRSVVVAIVAAMALVVAACGGSDESSSGSKEAFCAQLERIETIGAGLDEPDDAFIGELTALADAAPTDELRSAVNEVKSAIEILVSSDDPEQVAAQLENLDEQKFDEANAAIETYAVEDCGLDLE